MAASDASPTILLLGAGGQVGRELQALLPTLGQLRTADRAAADLADAAGLRAFVREARADVIVNAAAYTAVDKAESEPELATAINVVAPGVIAEEAARSGACLVHYSTDYVFDGRKDGPYEEDDATGPLQVYGRTKLAGERAIQAACERHLILRTSWVYAAHGHNFVRTMLRLAAERDTLRVVADQFGAPTSARLIAASTVKALRRLLAGAPAWGLYHLTAQGATSWHAFAQRVITRGLEAGLALCATSDSVVPITSAEYPVPAARPLNSRLACGRFERAFGVTLPPWGDDVDLVVRTLASLQHSSSHR